MICPNRGTKSGKRELALVLLLFWLLVAVKLFFVAPAADVAHYGPLFDAITWPILGAVFAVYGLDFWVKNGRGATPKPGVEPAPPKPGAG